jgi:plasmid maintenance system antidote protein VapI
MTEEQVYKALVTEIQHAGSQKKWARLQGLSESYVSDLVHCRRVITKDVAQKLGFTKEYVYFKISVREQ